MRSMLRPQGPLKHAAMRQFSASSVWSAGRGRPRKKVASSEQESPKSDEASVTGKSEESGPNDVSAPESSSVSYNGSNSIISDLAKLEWDRMPMRNTSWTIPYPADFSQHHPILDYPTQLDPSRFITKLPKDIVPTTTILSPKTVEDDPNELSIATGIPADKLKNLYIKTLRANKFSSQRSAGRIQQFYVLTVVGNKDGLVGIGEGTDAQFRRARSQALIRAAKSMNPVLRYQDRTIYGDYMKFKYGAVRLMMFARPPGFGLSVPPVVSLICEAAGIKDLGAKVIGSRNAMNVSKCAYIMLVNNQKTPEAISRERGRSIVDINEYYYSSRNSY